MLLLFHGSNQASGGGPEPPGSSSSGYAGFQLAGTIFSFLCLLFTKAVR
jgi:hypothetical protein